MVKPGPKPKPKAERRSKVVSVLFTEAEFRQIRKAAGPVSVSAYIRARTLEGPLEDTPRMELADLRRQAEHVLRRLDEVEKAHKGKGGN